MWVPVKLYKIKDSAPVEIMEGVSDLPSTGRVLMVASEERIFQSSVIVQQKASSDGQSITYRTRNGSLYLLKLMEEKQYSIHEDPWIDLGGEG